MKPPIPEVKNYRLTELHVWVDLKLEHPLFGLLHIDTFQRPQKECIQIVETKLIEYKSCKIPVNRHYVATKSEFYDLDGPEYYTFVIKEN